MRFFLRLFRKRKKTLLDELLELKAPPGYVPSPPEAVDLDALYPQAVELVFDKQDPSVEVLKEEMGLGYANAARLMDRMAAEGIVPDYVHGSGRRILITKEEWLRFERASVIDETAEQNSRKKDSPC